MPIPRSAGTALPGTWTAAALCLALIAAAFLLPEAVWAQEVGDDADHVDVALTLEFRPTLGYEEQTFGPDLTVVVMNHGRRTAYDVEVVVDIVYPTNTVSFIPPSDVPIGSVSMVGTPPAGSSGADGGDGYSLRWTIPTLPGLAYEEIEVRGRTRGFDTTQDPSVEIWDEEMSVFEFYGEVSTSSFDLHNGDNTDRIWAQATNVAEGLPTRVRPSYKILSLSVDEPNPSPGDIVNFTLEADPSVNIDSRVAIGLTDGLAVDEDPDATPPRAISTALTKVSASGETPDPVSYSDGVFTIGTRRFDESIGTLTATLPVRVASDAVVNEQCLTVTITGSPSPGPGPYYDDISDNVAKFCLGEQPGQVVFASGQSDLMTLSPCVGVTTYPCDTTDSIELTVGGGAAADNAGVAYEVFRPENVVVHIEGSSRRDVAGTGIRWHTGNDVDYSPSGLGILPGVAAKLVAPIAADGYSQHTFTIADATPGTGSNPGSVRWSLPSNDFTLLDTGIQSSLGPLDLPLAQYDTLLEFSSLGTYFAKITVGADHSSTSYTDTATYTFHVGPMADLKVEDGGASSHAATDQHALAIVAVNNGPDHAPGAKVTGLPGGAEVIHISQGAYDGSTGEWDIGELRVSDYYRSRGEPAPTLTLSASGGDTANVSIENSVDYTVCIGSDASTLAHTTEATCVADTANGGSWHEGTVYDYNADNDTATIVARAGAPPAPAMAQANPAAVTVTWDAVESLNGVPVSHYEVEWSADGSSSWTALADEVAATFYVDTGPEPGDTRYYRVRAVNLAGVKGPWSAPIAGMVEAPATAGAPEAPVLTTSIPDGASGRTEILLTWTKPVENGSPISSYTLQVADGGSGPWADVSPQPAVDDERYVYSDGLTGGTRKHFRMRATNMCDGDDPARECHSLWSAVVEATTRAPGEAGPPINTAATPDGDSAIDISWDPPTDDGGSPVLYYEVQWSADGASGWSNAGRTPDAETRTLKHSGLSFGTTRHYRVAARNGVTLGDWSDPPVSATTLAGVPGQPGLTARAADANTIELTWTVPADNGSPIIRYELEWSPDGSTGSWVVLTDPGASDTSYSHGGLDPGTERHYRIRAVNGATPGQGSWSAVRSATTPPAVPDAPTLRAEPNGENAIDLIWEPPSDDGGAEISGYEIHVSTDGTDGSYSRLTGPSATARSYTHGGLQPGDTRHYQARARNSAGWGEFSPAVSAASLTGVPAAPGLTARKNGSTEIKLTWTKPDDRGSDIDRYQVQESDDGSDWDDLHRSVPAGDTELVHTGLSGGTTKHYRIRAVNGNGDGQWSATRSATTDAGGPDAPVLTLTVAGDNQIDLGWTVPADNGSSIRGYRVERSADGDEPWERLTGSHSTTSYSDTTLYRGMTRHYRVAAYNSAGAGPYSGAESATTTGAPATAPEPPTLVRLSSVGRGEVTLAWEPPDDDGGAPVSGFEYEVARPCEGNPAANCGFNGDDIRATTGTSARITGLSTDGDYHFQVRAVNPVGKGEWSSAVYATLRPSANGQLLASPTTITVDEGATVTYTIRLSAAPPHPATVGVQPRGPAGSEDLQNEILEYQGKILIPGGWTHPRGEDWSGHVHNWSQGVRVTFTAPEDSDAEDDVVVVDHSVYPVPYAHYRPCRGHANEPQCEQDWDDAWASSPYRQLTGPSVIVKIRDND